jgi:RNA polymerase sigma-70 factor (sigma-E family)
MQIETETDPGPPPGDHGGFEAAYHRHRDRLRRLAYLITGRAEVAEELVQDAFVRLHGRWDEVDVPPAYLRTVVVRLFLHWRRRAAMGQERELRLVPTTRTTADPPEVDETWDLLRRLPPDQRAVLVLRFYEDLPMDEIAAVLGCRPATVRTRTHRALARLRKEMRP